MEINDWEYQQLVARIGMLYNEVWRLDITDKFSIKRDTRGDVEFKSFFDFQTWILEETANAKQSQPDAPPSSKTGKGSKDSEDERCQVGAPHPTIQCTEKAVGICACGKPACEKHINQCKVV